MEGVIHSFEERRAWRLEREINSGIYSAPGGCRGFGLEGLGHPLMS
jgi:hypothetical protein